MVANYMKYKKNILTLRSKLSRVAPTIIEQCFDGGKRGIASESLGGMQVG
jgi:hypothetical protein